MGEKRYQLELRSIGKRIQKIRKEKGMVQLDIEIKSGISRADISKIEHGKKNVEIVTLIKIAEALDVATSSFFTDLWFSDTLFYVFYHETPMFLKI